MAQPMDKETERHLQQWKGFVKLLTWSLIGIAVVLLLMRAFIVHSTAV